MKSCFLSLLITTLAARSLAATYFVNVSDTAPALPFDSWANAATNIQDAVDAATNGDLVLVTNGVYAGGGRVVFGAETNRVALTKPITLLSVNGPAAATIVGGTQTRCAYVGTNAALSGFTLANGSASGSDLTNEQSGGGAWCAVGGVVSNCYVVANDATIGGGVFGGTIYNSMFTNNGNNHNFSGPNGTAAFTALYNCMVISNGSMSEPCGGLVYGTASNCVFAWNQIFSGGCGVDHSTVYNSTILGNQTLDGGDYAAVSSGLYNCLVVTNRGAGAMKCILSNCVVSGNSGGPSGGGTYQGTNYNCTISGNSSNGNGGGVDGSICYNCIITGNAASLGGGGYLATLYNCTVVSNRATSNYGGLYFESFAYNSIVYYNSDPFNSNLGSTSTAYCCAPVATDPTSITNPPVFVNPAAGDYHEQTNSPTINDGLNQYAGPGTDFDGNPRIVGGTVDIGAYEYQGSNYNLPIPIQWLRQYGLPTDGSADYVDSDGDGMNNWQEWIAGTNPTNALSVLRMTSATNNAPGLKVTWQSVSNRTYYLLRGSDLTAQPTFAPIQSNIVGQASTTSYQDTSATNGGPYFYRVGVQ